MTRVRVHAGTCGFITRITAHREEGQRVCLEIESDCDAVMELGLALEQVGPFARAEVLASGIPNNRILELGCRLLSHAACPVTVGVIKAAEVELGLNVPNPVVVEFEDETTDGSATDAESS